LKSLNAYKQGLKRKVFILLIPFVSIFVINSVCSFQSVFFFGQDSEVAQNHHEEGHAHQHDENGGHSHGHQPEQKAAQNQQEDDGCCNDVTTLFFSNIFAQPDDFNLFHCENQVLVHNSSLNIVESNTLFVRLINPDLLLRQKIPDIRIYIQSFQI
jgi:hypothetical protein